MDSPSTSTSTPDSGSPRHGSGSNVTPSSRTRESASSTPSFIPDPDAVKTPPTEDSGTAQTKDSRPQPDTKQRRQFTKSLVATVASTVIPGSGLIGTRPKAAKVIGWLMVASAVVIGGSIAALAALDIHMLANVVVKPSQLRMLAGAMMILGLGWVSAIVGTHLLRRPAGLTRGQRGLGAGLVGVLCLAVSAPLAVASQYSLDHAALLESVFSSDSAKSQTRTSLEGSSLADIWANKPRLNILLLGGDSTAERLANIKDRGLLTDTIMVASIDTKTGEISLVQVPRNMEHTPFPDGSALRKKFPQGWYTSDRRQSEEYMVNTIWNNVGRDHADLLGGPSDYPGADALKLAVGEATGLKLDYFVMLNIDGLQALIDAMGGVTVNINQKLPIAGSSSHPEQTTGYLEQGPNQHLDGYNAMWYARSRWSTDDFDRMSRQSCLVNAIIKQSDPSTILTRYEAIAKASKNMVETDIPQSALPAVLDLALRVKTGGLRRLMFQNGVDGFVSANPDFNQMRQQVQSFLNPDTATTLATAAPSPISTPTPTKASPTRTTAPTRTPAPATQGPTATPSPAEPAQVADACAYNPVEPKVKLPAIRKR